MGKDELSESHKSHRSGIILCFIWANVDDAEMKTSRRSLLGFILLLTPLSILDIKSFQILGGVLEIYLIRYCCYKYPLWLTF